MTSLIKIWEIPGGIHPPQNKLQSTQLPLGNLPIPPELIIPLNQHIGAPAKPIVKIGDRVLAGQLIATADGVFSANVHASSSGVITAIDAHVLPHPSGISGESITIKTDDKHEWISLIECENFSAQDRSTLLEKISAAGVIGLGGAGFPTAIKLNPKSTQKIDTLIINGAECEPYITADDMLMQTRADQIISGALLLSHILHHPERTVIAIEDNKQKAFSALQQALRQFNPDDIKKIDIVSIPTKYPSGGAKQLIQIITGREIPSGRHSADINAICINVGTTLTAWRAVRFGEPLISRVTTIVGEALGTQRNIDVLIGTPIDYVLQHHDFNSTKAQRVIMGGSLMGFTLPDLSAPVIKTTNCIIAPSKKELPLPPPAQACIRCGLCSEVCPASLLPQQLFWYSQAEDFDRLKAHNLFDCIECGACSYVCPSKIPLVQYYRAAKGTIRLQVADKEKADRSRKRFEFRQKRFAREEALKETKRNARKLAADEAKLKLAEQKNNLSNEVNPVVAPTQVEAVVTAVAKASGSQLSYEEQKSRLERIVGAAKNSLDSARAPLVPRNIEIPITEEQLVKQKARIKQTELKLKEAEKKLADFIAEHSVNTKTVDDAVTTAIARAQVKLAISPVEKLRANIELLHSRLIKAQQKADEAKAEGAANAAILQLSAEKLQEKINEAEAELKSTPVPIINSTTPNEEQSAATAAIERAKARATAQANMSSEEKAAEQIKLIESRLEKARERLAVAETENNPNIEAFRLSVVKLEDKLKEINDASNTN